MRVRELGRHWAHGRQVPGLGPVADQGKHCDGNDHEQEEHDGNFVVGEVGHGESLLTKEKVATPKGS